MAIDYGLRCSFKILNNSSTVLVDRKTGASKFLRRLYTSLPMIVKIIAVFFFALLILLVEKY